MLSRWQGRAAPGRGFGHGARAGKERQSRGALGKDTGRQDRRGGEQEPERTGEPKGSLGSGQEA